MKILYVAQSFHPKVGGVENYIEGIATAMAKKGHEVFVLAPLYPNCKNREKYNGFSIIRVDFFERLKKGIFYHLRALNFSRQFSKTLKKINPEVVHFQYTNPFGILFFQTKMRCIKCFASVHGNDILFFRGDWFARYLLKLILMGMNGTFAVSDNSKKLLIEAGGAANKIFPVYNGTDLNKFKPRRSLNEKQNKKKFRVLTVCRLVERKGVDILIKAFYKVQKENTNIELYIVGEGPMENKLKELVNKLGIDNHVIFTGKVTESELIKHYQLCDIFVMVSRVIERENEVEGFGISIVEAMACGKPVIGANTGGIPSAIKGDWGFLVDPLDVDILSEKILFLIQNPDNAKVMGDSARDAVIRIYNWDVITDKIMGYYNSQ